MNSSSWRLSSRVQPAAVMTVTVTVTPPRGGVTVTLTVRVVTTVVRWSFEPRAGTIGPAAVGGLCAATLRRPGHGPGGCGHRDRPGRGAPPGRPSPSRQSRDLSLEPEALPVRLPFCHRLGPAAAGSRLPAGCSVSLWNHGASTHHLLNCTPSEVTAGHTTNAEQAPPVALDDVQPLCRPLEEPSATGPEARLGTSEAHLR